MIPLTREEIFDVIWDGEDLEDTHFVEVAYQRAGIYVLRRK
ncbi:helix-turn-helix domain-containing protein [Candidatus Woesearchaeota archaeon]|nr:helix-turn-helix domain-containing protein [Candidatus Woesearchaeota archaeon]